MFNKLKHLPNDFQPHDTVWSFYRRAVKTGKWEQAAYRDRYYGEFTFHIKKFCGDDGYRKTFENAVLADFWVG